MQIKRQRKMDTRFWDHLAFKVPLNKKHCLIKQITTKHMHVNPLMRREASYNHLVILITFLSLLLTDQKEAFSCCFFFFSWNHTQNAHFKSNMSKYKMTRTQKDPNTLPHKLQRISAHSLNIRERIRVWSSCRQVVILPIVSHQQVLPL